MKARATDPGAWLPWAIWLGGSMPLALLVLRGVQGDLGANPIEEALNACGELAIKCLLLCLACTPLRIISGSSWPMRARKHLGLLTFAYACAHLGVYVGLDRAGELGTLLQDVTERPFIIVGMVAFVLLVPLAATSSRRAIRWLGGKRWAQLHRLVYVVAILAVVHFVMRAKEDTTEAALHGAVLGVLLSVRVYDHMAKRRKRNRARAASALTQ